MPGSFLPIFSLIRPTSQKLFIRTFVRNPGTDFFWQIGKKKPFFGKKIGQFLANFSKNLEINKNHLNSFYVKILGHLDHFLAKYGHFLPFLAHFGFYNNIRKYNENPGRAKCPFSRYRPYLLNRSTDFKDLGHFGKQRLRAITCKKLSILDQPNLSTPYVKKH